MDVTVGGSRHAQNTDEQDRNKKIVLAALENDPAHYRRLSGSPSFDVKLH